MVSDDLMVTEDTVIFAMNVPDSYRGFWTWSNKGEIDERSYYQDSQYCS